MKVTETTTNGRLRKEEEDGCVFDPQNVAWSVLRGEGRNDGRIRDFCITGRLLCVIYRSCVFAFEKTERISFEEGLNQV